MALNSMVKIMATSSGVSVSAAGDINGDGHADLADWGLWLSSEVILKGAAMWCLAALDVGSSGDYCFSQLKWH